MISLKIVNYRCFAHDAPVVLELDKGFAAIVGANNSGKSALLRLFFDLRPVFLQLTTHDVSLAHALGQNEGLHPNSPGDHLALLNNSNALDMELDFRISDPTSSGGDAENLPLVDRAVITVSRARGTYRVRLFVGEEPLSFQGPCTLSGNSMVLGDSRGPVADIGPVDRAFLLLSKCFYAGSFRSILPYAGTAKEFDMIIGESFVQAWHSLKSGDSRVRNALADRVTRDIEEAFGFARLEINPAASGGGLHVRIDGKNYRLDEVGGGLAHFIVLLGNLAMCKASYLLIDEPESNLHPALQPLLLRIAASYASEGVIFATHSLGLAHSIADRALSVKGAAPGRFEVADLRRPGGLSEVAGELGITAYRELGYEGLLLVEGPNDVRTASELLWKYELEKRLVVLPLGGSDMINGTRREELAELARLSLRLWAIVDSEKSSSDGEPAANVLGFREVCTEVGVRCLVLERRAIENYFTEKAIREAMGEGYGPLTPYQRLKDAVRPWPKKHNWRIARAMTKDALEDSDLGRFLSEIAMSVPRAGKH